MLGFGIGCIPVLNEHLHWNLWYVVPISGFLFGLIVGFLQFRYLYLMNKHISRITLVIMAMGTLVSYIAIDYGIYTTSSIELSGVQGLEDGRYRLRDLMTFWTYAKINLGSSEVGGIFGLGPKIFEMGRVGTTVSRFADIIGATLGTVAVLFANIGKYPYCVSCHKYKKREDKYEIIFQQNEKTPEQMVQEIKDLYEKEGYNKLVSYIQDLDRACSDKQGDGKIVIDQRMCPWCYETTLLGMVYHLERKTWVEVTKLKFSFTNKQGAPTISV